ncbi:MAG TPA: transglycosylase domain-containing protein [Fibrobacteria bacterium]|nr:transglycosylase domain-containing protein [Fibrobacteria bacterium]HOX49902.1 transglycosylase domain-containing protein [Fibrobacteria bacterium]
MSRIASLRHSPWLASRVILVFLLGLVAMWFAMTEIVYQAKVSDIAPRITPPPAGTLPGVVRKIAWTAMRETGDIRMRRLSLGWFPLQIVGPMWSGTRGSRKWQVAGSSIASVAARNSLQPDSLSLRRTLHYQEEWLLATIWITRHWTVDQALMATVGKGWYGCGIHDLDTASRTYLGRPADSLSVSEAVVMMSILRNPGYSLQDSAHLASQFARLQAEVVEAYPELASRMGPPPRLVPHVCPDPR